MVKAVVINDSSENVEALAAPLRQMGIEVLGVIAPVDWEQVVDFGADVLVIGLTRAGECIVGLEGLDEVKGYPAIQSLPIVVVGRRGLSREQVNVSIRYDAFVRLPEERDTYTGVVQETANAKRRKKISGFVCPVCKGRLFFFREPALDLFCPGCGTAVAITSEKACIFAKTSGPAQLCTLEEILPPRARR